MSKLVAQALRGQFEAVVGHRNARQWAEARSTLAEIETYAEDLGPEGERVCKIWIEIHGQLVEAARLSSTFQEEAELVRLGKARYLLELILDEELERGSEERLLVEWIHADVAFGELDLALRLGAFRGAREHEMVQKRDELQGAAISRAKELAMHRLRDQERFEHLPGWMRMAMEKSSLGLVILVVEERAALNEPATLLARLGALLALGGDPNVSLKLLFEDPEFLSSFRRTTRAALDGLLEKPAAAELYAWMKTRWDGGLSAGRYEVLMAQLRRDVMSGWFECMPELSALENATQPEHRCRACASLIGKLAEHAYRPALQILALLTREGVESRMSVGKLIATLEAMWRPDGPFILLDRDVATIRNSECHARTVYEAQGARVRFENNDRVLGPMSREDLERRLESLLDHITTILLFACYVGHPNDPRSLGRAVGHPSHTEVALQP